MSRRITRLERRIEASEGATSTERAVTDDGVEIVVTVPENPVRDETVRELLTDDGVDIVGASPAGERRELKLRVR